MLSSYKLIALKDKTRVEILKIHKFIHKKVCTPESVKCELRNTYILFLGVMQNQIKLNLPQINKESSF